MATNDARAELADALSALGETLRHHRDLGFTEATLSGDVLLGPAEALAAPEKAAQGCRQGQLCPPGAPERRRPPRPRRGARRPGKGRAGLPQVQALRGALHCRVRLRESAGG